MKILRPKSEKEILESIYRLKFAVDRFEALFKYEFNKNKNIKVILNLIIFKFPNLNIIIDNTTDVYIITATDNLGNLIAIAVSNEKCKTIRKTKIHFENGMVREDSILME